MKKWTYKNTLSLNSSFFFLFAQDTHLHLRLCTEVILSSMHSGRFPSTCSARTVTQRSRPLWRMRQGPWPGWFASSWYCLGRCHLCCIARMSKLISPQEFDFISMSNIKKGSSDNQNALFKFTFFYGCTLQTISMYFAIGHVLGVCCQLIIYERENFQLWYILISLTYSNCTIFFFYYFYPD